MKIDIYDIELLEFKKTILKEMNSDLEDIISFKLRRNSNAYNELKKLIADINLRRISIKEEINRHDKNIHSNIKIEIDTLKNLINLKNELEIDTISELLKLIIENFKDIFLIQKLTEISHISLEQKKITELCKTNFYICTNETFKEKLVYKIDDLIIHNNIEYLNVENFKTFVLGNETFKFSSRFTLNDIDIFNSIW